MSLADRFDLIREAVLAGNEAVLSCAFEVFGMDRMIEFDQGAQPTAEELVLGEPCLLEGDGSDQIASTGPEYVSTYSGFDVWAPVATVSGIACPEPTVNHAASGDFNWQVRPMLSGEVANFAVSPTAPNVVYMGIEENAHAVQRSDDFGETWTVLHRFDHAKDVAVHPTDPNIAFHADSTGIWRTSTGRFESYSQVLRGGFIGPPQTAFPTIVISPSNPEIVYTAQKGDDDPNGLLYGGLVYRSGDGGLTFSTVGRRTPVVNVLAVDPENADHVFIGSTDGLHDSRDGGRTWSAIAGSAGLGKVIDIKTVDGVTWFAATPNGVARSDDGGRTWRVFSKGLPGLSVQRVGLVRNAPQVVWATTRSGVALSNDGGRTFEDVTGFGSEGGLPAVNLQALAVWPDDPRMALVATSSLVYSARSDQLVEVQGQLFGQGVFKTTDAGRTWRQVALGVVEDTIIELQTSPVRPTEVWAGQPAARGIFRSRDAGQSWSQSNSHLTHYPMKMAFVPGYPDRIVFTSSHPSESFGLTKDSGVSWSTKSEQAFFEVIDEGVDLFDANQSSSGSIHLHGLAVAPDDPNLILVGSVNDPAGFANRVLTGSHIYRSEDGGVTWAESMDGYDFSAAASIHDIVFDPVDPDRVYIATTAQESISGNGVWRSDDRGMSWVRVDDWTGRSSEVNEVVVHPTDGRSVIAATGGGLYVSTDRGGSWERTDDSYAWDADADVSRPGVVYAGTVDGVLVSTDFGQTWSDISPDWFDRRMRGWGLVNIERATGATVVGVSCDGGIVYAGFAGVGTAVSVAPGYATIPEDPDQISRMSGRGIPQHYDEQLMRLRIENRGSSVGGQTSSAVEEEGPSDGPRGLLDGLMDYVVDCARERMGAAWDELEAGRTPTMEEEDLVAACQQSGGTDTGGGAEDQGSGGAASGGEDRLRGLSEEVKNCIRANLPDGVWSDLWDLRRATDDEHELIGRCESGGGPEGSGSGGVPTMGEGRLRGLSEEVKNCVRAGLTPGVWDEIWNERPATDAEHGLIGRCQDGGNGSG
jgi:photosystem II stability/assembly factor-like uncharacterized protein